MIYGGHTYHLDDLGETVAQTVYDLSKHISKFDFIVVTGVSGTIVGAPVAVALEIPLVVVRKPTDDTHDNQDVVNYANAVGRWIFVDDFVATGYTIKRVTQRMSETLKAGSRYDIPEPPIDHPVYAGSYMYGETDGSPFTWESENEPVEATSDFQIAQEYYKRKMREITPSFSGYIDPFSVRHDDVRVVIK